MTDLEMTVEENRDSIMDLARRVERLERGVVSGATTCYAGASASGGQVKADEEERSDEPRGQARYAGEGCARYAAIKVAISELTPMLNKPIGLDNMKTVRESIGHLVSMLAAQPESDCERSEQERRRNA